MAPVWPCFTKERSSADVVTTAGFRQPEEQDTRAQHRNVVETRLGGAVGCCVRDLADPARASRDG